MKDDDAEAYQTDRHDSEVAYEAMKRHIQFVLDFFEEKKLE